MTGTPSTETQRILEMVADALAKSTVSVETGADPIIGCKITTTIIDPAAAVMNLREAARSASEDVRCYWPTCSTGMCKYRSGPCEATPAAPATARKCEHPWFKIETRLGDEKWCQACDQKVSGPQPVSEPGPRQRACECKRDASGGLVCIGAENLFAGWYCVKPAAPVPTPPDAAPHELEAAVLRGVKAGIEAAQSLFASDPDAPKWCAHLFAKLDPVAIAGIQSSDIDMTDDELWERIGLNATRSAESHEEERKCDHEDYDLDILSGRASCNMCPDHWYLSNEELERDTKRREVHHEDGEKIEPPTTTGESGLRECPFCGGHATCASNLEAYQAGAAFDLLHWIFCVECRAQTVRFKDAQHAINAWNSRTASTPRAMEGDAVVVSRADLLEIEDTLQVAPIPADGVRHFETWAKVKRDPAIKAIEAALTRHSTATQADGGTK